MLAWIFLACAQGLLLCAVTANAAGRNGFISEVLYPLRPAFTTQNPHKDVHNPLEHFIVNSAALDLDNKVQIAVNTSWLDHSGQWVEVTWQGVPFPSYDDYIALYSDGADVTATAPIKFKLAAGISSHVLTGAGATSFRILNFRVPLRFAVLRGGLQFPRVAAWSDPIIPARVNEPTQGHLSLTATSNEMAVQWTTRDKPIDAPAVQWGTIPGQYTFTSVGGTTQSYTRAEMCGPPANTTGWLDPGKFHYAIMTGLTPGQRYYYRYGGKYKNMETEIEEEEWSEESSFVAPPVTSPQTSVRLLAVADLGQVEIDGSMEISQMDASLATTNALAWEISNNGAQLLIHNGDVSYARGFSSQWDVYWNQLGPAVRDVPYMTVPGNHERDWPGSGDRYKGKSFDSGGECGVAYNRRMNMPTAGPSLMGPNEKGEILDQPWYSFDFGPIHFLQYSTEHDFDPGSPQHDFISADLAAVDRTKTPWIVVGGHRPIYIDSVNWSPLVEDDDLVVAAALRAALEDLFLKYQVDVTWHGHHHSYQRTCKLAHGKCVASSSNVPAPVHLVIGHAGFGLSPNVHLWRPRIFEKVVLLHGYLRVEANATHMRQQSVVSSTGLLMDDFTLIKGKKGGNEVVEHM